MIDLMQFTNEELLQIVELIPVGLIREFFKQKPKTLNRIKPGFRAAAIPQSQYCPLLVKAIKATIFTVPTAVKGFTRIVPNMRITQLLQAPFSMRITSPSSQL